MRTYELLTLTYGTASASFLTTRVIQELANHEKDQYLKSALIARRDFTWITSSPVQILWKKQEQLAIKLPRDIA